MSSWKLRFAGQLAIVLLGAIAGLSGLERLTTAPVQAYEASLSVTLDRAPDETFQTLVKRAEIVARAAVQRAFDTDILATDVSVFINGNSGGLEAPLLSIQISRFQWQSFPDARRWATYYPAAQSLLRLNPLPTSTTGATIAPNGAPITPGSTLAPSGNPTSGQTAAPSGTNPSGTAPTGTDTGDTQGTQFVVPDTIRPINLPTQMPSTVPDELLLDP